MVLILSQNKEASTQKVIDWLMYYGVPWVRLNETDALSVESIVLAPHQEPQIILNAGGTLLDLSAIKSYWYRRGWLNILPYPHFSINDELSEIRIKQYLKEESENLVSFIYWYLKTFKHSLSDFYEADNKKLPYLVLAAEAGLMIPETFITSRQENLNDFQDNFGPLITKSIHEVLSFSNEQNIVYSFTTDLSATTRKANQPDQQFFPSLFQRRINKKIELRIFFIGQDLYPMAIFSQENNQTATDFRNYDQERPNRNVPFTLPAHIKSKVIKFIELSRLNTGSIDMILTEDNEYIFLEVNPVGQFDMTSKPCNYYLEERITQYLAYGY